MKSEHNTFTQTLAVATFTLCFLGIGCLGFNTIVLKIYGGELLVPDTPITALGVSVLLGFFMIFIFYIVSFAWVLHVIRTKGHMGVFDLIVLIYDGFCLLLLLGVKTMIDEIAREWQLGWQAQGEQTLLFAFLVVQCVYNLLVLGHLYRTHQSPRTDVHPVRALCDDTLFQMAHWVGCVCGLLGLIVNMAFMRKSTETQNVLVLISTYTLILIPYGITVFFWLLTRIEERVTQWYDEKQLQDISKAGFVTLLLSIPGMAALFLVGDGLQYFWFPHFLFLILLLFSVTTLCLNRYFFSGCSLWQKRV